MISKDFDDNDNNIFICTLLVLFLSVLNEFKK